MDEKKYYRNDEYLTSNQFSYTKEEVEEMYYKHYFFNLKQIILSKEIEGSFFLVKDLMIRPGICKKHWFVNTTNSHLLTSDKLKLGRDIYENGTYWHSSIMPVKNIENYVVRCGNHRFISLRLLQIKKEIPLDYKIFCFILSDEFLTAFAQDNESENFLLKQPITIYLNKEIYEKAKEFKKRFINTEIEEINSYTIKLQVNNAFDLWYSIHSYSLFLRELLTEYKIKPYRIFDNEKLMEDFLNAQSFQ